METIGSYLKSQRERAGISLEQVAMSTKIRQGVLLHLEAEQLEAIPDGVFLRGFVKAYCLSVGADIERALDILESQTGATMPVVAEFDGQIADSNVHRRSSSVFKVAMVVLAFLGLVGAYVVTSTVQDDGRAVSSVEGTDVDSGTTRSFSPVEGN